MPEPAGELRADHQTSREEWLATESVRSAQAAVDRSEVSAEPMGIRELADVIERAFRPIAEAVRQAVGNGPSVHADGPGGVGEGTERGEGQGGAEEPSLTDLIGLDPNLTGGLDAVEYVRRQNCDHGPELDRLRAQVAELESEVRVLTTTGDGQLVLADAERDRLKAERDGLRGKVEAVRALHTEYEGRCTACVEYCDCLDRGRRSLEYCTHGNVEWPCPTIQALDGGEGVNAD